MTAPRLGLAAAAATLALDQASKAWMLALLFDPPRAIRVAPFLDLVPVWNRGISFGLFAADAAIMPYLLSAFAAAVVVVLAIWLHRAANRHVALALGLIIGGAVGNVIDRMRFGAVADFIDLHVGGWHWPAFNVADSAITIGVALLVLDALSTGREERKNRAGGPA